MAGIYIHIPFCSQYCTYCNFYSVKQLGLRERFVEAVVKEAESKKDFFKNRGSSVTTLYIGGGTPSVLLPEQLGIVVEGVKEAFNLSFGSRCARGDGSGDVVEEFTIEVNPDDVTPEYALFLKKLGVNRVSMGIQSFIDPHLQWMNRRHSAEGGERAYRILRDAGIENISIDLIFGYSLLLEKDWLYNISRVLDLAPEHISAYQMSIEPGSALGAMAKRGCYKPLSDEACERQYLLLQKKLSEAGYMQYEISNFAKDCKISLHNSSYWNGTPYLGLGPAAHSYTGVFYLNADVAGKRMWNNPSVRRYCECYCNGDGRYPLADAVSGIEGYEILSTEDIFNEIIMLGLRRVCGFSLDSLACLNNELLQQINHDISRLVSKGNLIKEGNNIRIPAEKLFISDAIIRELFLYL